MADPIETRSYATCTTKPNFVDLGQTVWAYVGWGFPQKTWNVRAPVSPWDRSVAGGGFRSIAASGLVVSDTATNY